MSPLEKWSLHAAAAVTGATGVLDGILRWFGERAGEFGPEPHPWLAGAQHLHVLAAPLLVFCLGALVRGHVQSKLRQGETAGRGSGIRIAALIAPMIMSGYLVQVATSPALRTCYAWVHGISSAGFLLAYAGHLAVLAWRSRTPLTGAWTPLEEP